MVFRTREYRHSDDIVDRKEIRVLSGLPKLILVPTT